MFFVFPQGDERVRLYFCTSLDQRDRFAGPDRPRRFLETFRTLAAVRLAETLGEATPIGPCATLSGEDSWSRKPSGPGVALIGDAAGYNDPIIGEGLSLAMRDVRVLSEILREGEDWSVERRRRFQARIAAGQRPRAQVRARGHLDGTRQDPRRLPSKNPCAPGFFNERNPAEPSGGGTGMSWTLKALDGDQPPTGGGGVA